jgi:rare lipoprotein A
MMRTRASMIFVLAAMTAIASCQTRPPVVVTPPPEPVAAPAEPEPAYQEVGKASWYGAWHQGRKTASGERFDQNKLTAAHPSLPLGTEATVTNLENGKSVEVTINDRGPYVKNRAIDLSTKAAKQLGMKDKGIATVKIEVKAEDDATETASSAQ